MGRCGSRDTRGILGLVSGRFSFGLFWNGLGPVGCHRSGYCGGMGIWMHSSTLTAIKARPQGRAAFRF